MMKFLAVPQAVLTLLLWIAVAPFLQAETTDSPSLSNGYALTPVPHPSDVYVTVTSTLWKFIHPSDVVTTRTTTRTLWTSTSTVVSTSSCTNYSFMDFPPAEPKTYTLTSYITLTSVVSSATRRGITTGTASTHWRTGARPYTTTVLSCTNTLVWVDITTAKPSTITWTSTYRHSRFIDLTTVCHYGTTATAKSANQQTTTTTVPTSTTTPSTFPERTWTTTVSTTTRFHTPTDYVFETLDIPETTTLVWTHCLNPTSTIYVITGTTTSTTHTTTSYTHWPDSICSSLSSRLSSEEADLLPEPSSVSTGLNPSSAVRSDPTWGPATTPASTTPVPAYAYPSPTPVAPTHLQLHHTDDDGTARLARRQSSVIPGAENTETMETFSFTWSTGATVYVTASTPYTLTLAECPSSTAW